MGKYEICGSLLCCAVPSYAIILDTMSGAVCCWHRAKADACNKYMEKKFSHFSTAISNGATLIITGEMRLQRIYLLLFVSHRDDDYSPIYFNLFVVFVHFGLAEMASLDRHIEALPTRLHV